MTDETEQVPQGVRSLLGTWSGPIAGVPEIEVYGADGLLANRIQTELDAESEPPLIAFHPSLSDLAKAVGLPANADGMFTPDEEFTHEAHMDVLREPTYGCAVNHIVLGTAPDFLGWGSSNVSVSVEVEGTRVFSGRASAVVIAIGQFIRGHDVVPKGHPADGVAEVQVYHLRRSERKGVRARLRLGQHLPHPRIVEAKGKQITLHIKGRACPVEADGRSWGTATEMRIEVLPHAYRLALP